MRQTDPTPTLLNFQPLCLEVIASLKHTDNCQENPYLLSVLLGNSGGQTQPLLAEGSALRPVTHTPSSRSLQLLPGSALPAWRKFPAHDPALTQLPSPHLPCPPHPERIDIGASTHPHSLCLPGHRSLIFCNVLRGFCRRNGCFA